MPRHTRLHRRNGTYYLPAAVPEELRPAYGKAEVWKSLRTKDPQEANRLVKIERLKVDQEFEALRKRLAVPAVDISESEAERLAALHVHDWIEEDEEARMEGLSERDYRKYAEALDIVEAGNGYALARGDISVIEFEIDEVLDRHGLNIPKGSPGYRRLGFALLKASLRANELLQARHAGKVVDTPSGGAGRRDETGHRYTLTRWQPPAASSIRMSRSRKRWITAMAVRVCEDGLTVVKLPPPARAMGTSNWSAR